MLKFLFMGDRHNAETIPVARTDNYHETCELKDAEIIKIARENNVNAIIHPGDFWTDADKRLSYKFVGQISQRWQSGGIPVIGIAGNHDLIGNNIKSFPDTTSGLLNSLGVFKIIENDEVLSFTDGKITVNITGTNYHNHMDKPECIDDYIVSEKTSDYHIHIVHGMLTSKSYGKLFRHTLIDQIKDTAADITLCGHDHIGFGVVNYNNKYFINPGAVVRLTAAEKEMKRSVQVVLISIDETGIKVESIPLTSARPGSEVLNRDHLEEKEEKEAFQEYIKDGVAKLQLGTGLSIHDVLDEIYTRDAIPDRIKSSITKSITAKTTSLNAAKKVAPKDTKIVKIKLYNFQSHANTELDLTKHFNVVIGESNQGKTSILRAIRWVAENKPSGKGMVRLGETDAYVELTLESGIIIKRYISGRDNGYKIFYPDGTVHSGNTKSVSKVQEILGWCHMPIGENEDLPLNHLRQGDSAYLIGDGYSSTDRARILGAINNTDGADATIKELEKENGKINEAIKHEHVEISVLSSEIEDANKEKAKLLKIRSIIEKAIMVEKIKHFLMLRDEYILADEQLQTINSLFNEAELIKKIANIHKKINDLKYVNERVDLIRKESARIEQITPIVQQLDKTIDHISPQLIENRMKLEKYVNINNLIRERTLYEAQLQEACSKEKTVANVVNINTAMIRQKLESYQMIKNAQNNIHRANWVIESANNFIQHAECVERFPEQKHRLHELIEKYNKISQLLNAYQTHNSEASKYAKICVQADEEYDIAIQHKIDILQESHICPLCYSVIDEQAVEQIIEKSKKE